ncbi:hypothetical protein Tco_0290544, partial [Tanacetum coccineum]
MPGCSWREHLQGVHYCPDVLGGDTYKGCITARVFLRGTPTRGTFLPRCSWGGTPYKGTLLPGVFLEEDTCNGRIRYIFFSYMWVFLGRGLLTIASVAEVPSASTLQVLRRLGSIFTLVYAAVQKLKKDSWLELQFSLADNSKLNVNKFEGDNTPIVIQPPCYSASKDFQDSLDDEEDIRSSHEYLND